MLRKFLRFQGAGISPEQFLEQAGRLLTPSVMAWITGGSVAGFILSLLLVARVIAVLPADYFTGHYPAGIIRSRYPAPVRILIFALKNLVGLILLLAGVLMLFLPGQGLLTILIGLIVMDFPGKRALEKSLARRPAVMKALNLLRRRAGRPPFSRMETGGPGDP